MVGEVLIEQMPGAMIVNDEPTVLNEPIGIEDLGCDDAHFRTRKAAKQLAYTRFIMEFQARSAYQKRVV